MTDTALGRAEEIVVINKKIGILGVIAVASILIGAGFGYAALLSRVAALEMRGEADNKKIAEINERTIEIKADLVWIRAAMRGQAAIMRSP